MHDPVNINPARLLDTAMQIAPSLCSLFNRVRMALYLIMKGGNSLTYVVPVYKQVAKIFKPINSISDALSQQIDQTSKNQAVPISSE